MSGKTLFIFISSVCMMAVLACLWHTTSKSAGRKLPPLPKPLLNAADEGRKPPLFEKLPNAASEEVKMQSLAKTLSYAEDSKKNMPSLPNTLPYPAKLKKLNVIQKALWVTHLYQFLQSLNKSISPQVNMVFGDSDHINLVLNWIIAAHVRLDPPLHNIMVLSLDQLLCDFLVSKQLPVTCIAVPPQSFLKSPGPKHWTQGVKCRLFVLRIINFWGYDVASYDSDAVLLRNPQPLYDSNPDVKLFAGSGVFPFDISKRLGFALCSCVLLLRSHPSTENLWRNIHNTKLRPDQATFNYALQNLGIRWKTNTTVKNICSVRSGWESYGPLKCLVFSQEDVCRRCCEDAHKHNYYILHPITNKDPERKPSSLKNMHAWFLKDSWRQINRSAKGKWLRSISMYRDF